MSWAKRVVAAGLFPLTLATSLCLAWLALAAGWPPLVALCAGLLSAWVCFVAERVMPHAKEWQTSRGDILTDATHAAVSQLGGGTVAELAVHGITVALALAVAVPARVWPTEWPVAAQLAVALVTGELAQYAWHRVAHHSALWRLHATHHSTLRLYFLASSRFHPVEVIGQYIATYLPLVLLGAPAVVLVLVSVVMMTCGVFQHANVDVRLGPLNWIFSGPELHRWHHTSELATQNTNYGGILIVWDIVFGTRYLPERAPDPRDVGFAGAAEFPRGYVGQLLSPWTFATRPPSSARAGMDSC